MAQDRTINALAIVAIIGGIFKRRISKKLTTPTAIPDESATRMPKAIKPFALCIAPIDSAPDSAITEGMERSILPGPLVITSICPSETSTGFTGADARYYERTRQYRSFHSFGDRAIGRAVDGGDAKREWFDCLGHPGGA